MLQLSDGTQLECQFFGLASAGVLYIDIPNMTIPEAVSKFGDSNATKKMTYTIPNETVIREGFTVLLGVQIPAADATVVRVTMRKPYTDESEESQEVLQYKAALEMLGIETGVNES